MDSFSFSCYFAGGHLYNQKLRQKAGLWTAQKKAKKGIKENKKEDEILNLISLISRPFCRSPDGRPAKNLVFGNQAKNSLR